MKQFDSSYETIEETNGVKYRYFLSRQGRQPTAHGHRGEHAHGGLRRSSLQRERNQCLIGILVSGVDDSGVRLNASWERHEHVLPLRCERRVLRAMT